jgi:biotin carboxylase
MHKRILILGGSNFQIPLIRLAKERGLHVITCDYLPSNPGHAMADEHHDVSTTDKDGVLALARRIGVDAVATLSSEPALQTVSYVANTLGLPGAPLDAIIKLTEKDKFRALMAETGLRVPASIALSAAEAGDAAALEARLVAGGKGHVVKPVDSCGSKGITVLDAGSAGLAPALRLALDHSLAKRCIVEEYIEGEQIHGDGFLRDGQLVYHYLGNHIFYTKTHNRIPVSTRWPSGFGDGVLEEIARQVETIAGASGYVDGPVNIEARVTPAGEVFIIEVAPRNGGNYVPIIQQQLTGFDFVGKVLDGALGIRPELESDLPRRGVGAHYVLHADRDARFAGLQVSDRIKDKILSLNLFKHEGEPVQQFVGSHTTIGVVLLRFDSVAERDQLMADARSHLAVILN